MIWQTELVEQEGENMSYDAMTRRNILKTLSVGIAATSVLSVIPAEAAEHAHEMIVAEQAASPTGTYAPKFFVPRQWKMLQQLCQTIIPPDEHSGGAIEAGAPEWIDLVTSENEWYQRDLSGGMVWLDAQCGARYGTGFLESAPEQQKEILDLIAYRKNAKADPSLQIGVEFFSQLRELAMDGYFTSEIGVKDLDYRGNKFLKNWTGCPPVPGLDPTPSATPNSAK